MPRYELSSAPEQEKHEPKFLRDGMDYSDVTSSFKRRTFVHSKKRPKTFNNLKKNFIKTPRTLKMTNKFDVKDINDVKWTSKRETHPLDPHYNMNLMKFGKVKGSFVKRKVDKNILPNFNLKTDDIIGARADTKRRVDRLKKLRPE